MAKLALIATDVPRPPEQSGESYFIVKQGQTIILSSSSLMVSTPPYVHKNNLPIGSLKFVGYGINTDNIVKSNGTPIIAQIENNGNIVRYNKNTNTWTNEVVTKQILDTGSLAIKGNSIGLDFVNVVYTAYSPTSNKESAYTTDVGKIWIKVVSPTGNNQPPSTVGNNNVPFTIGTAIVLNNAMFTTMTTPAYSDPENDAPKSLKIITLPSLGNLLYNGIPVVALQEISMLDLSMGKLTYTDYGFASQGMVIPFDFEVSDMGSGNFTG